MESLWQDLRYGARVLFKQPGFMVAVVLTLALGIGTNTAIFSIIDAVIWRPLPFAQPDRLVTLWSETADGRSSYPGMTVETALEWHNHKQIFEQVEGYTNRSFVLTGGAEPEQLVAMGVSPGLFPLLGVRPQMGRSFIETDAEPGNNRIAIISHALWQKHFGADQSAIGKSLTLNDQPYTVVGVMPQSFVFPRPRFQLWVPLSLNPTTEAERQGRVEVLTRLRPGLTLPAAQTEARAVVQRLNQERPTRRGWGMQLHRLDETRINPGPRRAMLLLFGAVGFVLLIACANAANLLLARSAMRGREIAIRAALGAGRWRLVRQLLIESFILAALGGICGVLLAQIGVDLISKLAPQALTFLSINNFTIDRRVLIFTLTVSCLTGLICGLMPALKASRPDLNWALKGVTRTATADRPQQRLRQALIVAEVAISFVLLIGAGLMIRSFLRLSHVSPGFEIRNLLTLSLNLPSRLYPTIDHQRNFLAQVQQRIAAVPGVEGVTVATGIPPRGGGFSFNVEVEVEGRSIDKLDPKHFLPFNSVAPNYFQVLRIPFLRGRTFEPQDVPSTPRVIIINDQMANKYWPNDDPIGKRIRFYKESPWMTVVGVVGDVKAMGLSDENGGFEYYTSSTQDKQPGGQQTLVVRTLAEPASLAPAIKAQVWAIDNKQAFYTVSTAEEMLDESLAESRFYLLLMAIFAGSAIVLAALGLYGVISYTVTQRTSEIGIRIALGARPNDVLKLVIGQALALTLIGVGLGLAAAFWLTRLLSSLLFNISVTDPVTFVAIGFLMIIVALIACYLPARRAARVDPLVALRCD
jgi:putative ABC transport system permease protein